ncbi:MAG: M6 family metalloprotease domain-containing protein [Gemmatimonadales bacterium]
MKRSLLLPCVACAFFAPGLFGQDIEALAQASGRKLPAQYYQRIQRSPDFFEVQDGWIARTHAVRQAQSAVTGALPIAVVLALFSDSNEPVVTEQDVQRSLFDGPSDNGTVSDFYSEVSGGRFTIDGHALPWVRTDLTMAETVGSSFGLGADSRVGEYLIQALAIADSTTDFGEFDNDGPDGIPNSGDDDGFVDAVAFQFAEVAASCGGPAIWPHRSRISGWTGGPFLTHDSTPDGEPLAVDDYIVQSAVTCAGTAIQNAATIAHELGHVLGLPDLYDASDGIEPEKRRWVVGCWGLMAAGSWGCGKVLDRSTWNRPTHMSPWSKDKLGWITQRVVGDVLDQEFTLGPVQITGEVLKIPLTPTEFLLLEYRPAVGFDVNLPASGVLVYHIDLQLPLRPCPTCEKVYRVALVEADGNRGLVRPSRFGGNRGEAGDAFAVDGPARLSNSTRPSTRLNAGGVSSVTISSIAVGGGRARIQLSSIGIAMDRLLERFTGIPTDNPLNVEEVKYLDRIGNGNGSYDVGDLRAYLRR